MCLVDTSATLGQECKSGTLFRTITPAVACSQFLDYYPMNIPTFGFWFFDELAPMIGLNMPRFYVDTPNYGGFQLKASGLRLECLVSNNQCVVCKRVGTLWLLQAHHCHRNDNGDIILRENPHLNLYTVDDDDSLVLMTRDHIVPRSKGGLDVLENLQTMCTICNNAKGNTLPDGQHNGSPKTISC